MPPVDSRWDEQDWWPWQSRRVMFVFAGWSNCLDEERDMLPLFTHFGISYMLSTALFAHVMNKLGVGVVLEEDQMHKTETEIVLHWDSCRQ